MKLRSVGETDVDQLFYYRVVVTVVTATAFSFSEMREMTQSLKIMNLHSFKSRWKVTKLTDGRTRKETALKSKDLKHSHSHEPLFFVCGG